MALDLTGRLQRPPQDSLVVFSAQMAETLASAYQGGLARDDLVLHPLQADLTGIPPLLIHAGSGDSVLQEAQLLGQLAQQHGVDVQLDVYPVATHAFHSFWSFLPEAMEAVKAIGDFIRVALPEAALAREAN